MNELFDKLDITEFIEKFKTYFARAKDIAMEGDINLHYRYIKTLKSINLKAPPSISDLDGELILLKKQAVLPIGKIYDFVQIIAYFHYLKSLKLENIVGEWLDKIKIDEDIALLQNYFDKEGALQEDATPKLDSLNKSLKHVKEDIANILRRTVSSQKLQPYLIDRQIHYIDQEECLLLRGGFSVAIRGKVVSRSSGGFFYITPESIRDLKQKEDKLFAEREEEVYALQKEISIKLTQKVPYLTFVNKEFDRFDHYQSRVRFANDNDYAIILPEKSKQFKIVNFRHPAVHNPKPLSFEFSKSILLVTGANAGGKTIFLKSLLASSLMAKYLIPMSIGEKSEIPLFKQVVPIIEDPQNSKNDISTFAGRMREFSVLFSNKNFIAGVDEIELGTDSDEAAALFKAVLEELIKRDVKIIITTHHKRLAALMSDNPETELAAAIFDEERAAPTYGFLKGTIGKSYAFETALRYGIPYGVVTKAREIYGEDKDRLNHLIQHSFELERELKAKIKEADEKLVSIDDELLKTKALKEQAREEKTKLKGELEREYKEAIEMAKQAAKKGDKSNVHKAMNAANSKYKQIKEPDEVVSGDVQIGDYVKYRNKKGEVLTVSGNKATVDMEGIKVVVSKRDLVKVKKTPTKKEKIDIRSFKPENSSFMLDLHGLRSEEAVDKLDKFISDALASGFDEVVVYHGIGTGKLAFAVRQFLDLHPKVVEYSDAPLNLGGYGAKVVRF